MRSRTVSIGIAKFVVGSVLLAACLCASARAGASESSAEKASPAKPREAAAARSAGAPDSSPAATSPGPAGTGRSSSAPGEHAHKKKEEEATIRGRVAGDDGKAVPRATVRILPRGEEARRGRRRPPTPETPVKLETAEDGSFEARGLSGASFTLRVDAPGYAPFTAPEVPAGASVKVALKRGHSLSGIVRDLETKKPVANATVLGCDPDASRFGEDACRRARSTEEGTFKIDDLPRGAIDLEARSRGHAAARLPGVAVPPPAPPAVGAAEAVDAPAPRPIELYLPPGGRLAGRVVGTDGKPVEGVGVTIRPTDLNLRELLAMRDGLDTLATDAQGRFAFEGLPAGGRYRLVARKKGYAQGESGPFEVRAGTDRGDIEMRVDAGATLAVRLVDRDERPVRGLEVELIDAERGGGPAPMRFRGGNDVDPEQITEGEDGRYTVKALQAGTYTVRLLPEGWADVERENVKLRDGETTDLGTIVVREGRSLSGRITDRALAPVAGAEVFAFWTEEAGFKTRRARSKADGRYRIAGLGEDPVQRLFVTAKGFARADRDGAVPGDDQVDFVLDRTGSVVGRVVVEGGSAPVAFRVKAHPEASRADQGFMRGFMMRSGPPVADPVFTDPTGAFRLDDLDPGTYTLEAIADRKAPGKKAGIRIEAEQVADAGTITLRDGIALRGRAVQAKDEAPVAGAAVRIEAPRAMPMFPDLSPARSAAITTSDGSFLLEGLEAGAHMVTVEHPDYSPSRARVELRAEEQPPEFVARMSRGGALTGAVRDAQGLPIPEARIIVMRGMGQDMETIVTGPDGRYLLERLAPGTYQAMRAPEGRAIAIGLGMKSAEIREGETTTLDFDETAKVTLTGRVLRGSEPIGGALLVFVAGEALEPGELKTAQSDASGEFRVGLDRGGAYEVSVQTGGLARMRGGSSVKIVVPEQAEVRQDIVLRANAISGRVTEAGGGAVRSALVTARRDGAEEGPGGRLVAQSGVDGTYAIEGLEPGTYRVTASAAGYRNAEVYPVAVSDEAPPPTADLSLEKGRGLRGRVVDPQGQGLGGALVFVAPAGTAGSALTLPATTDVNGTFDVTAPTEGPIDVAAIPPGWAPVVLSGIVPPPEREGDEGVRLQATLGGRVRVTVLGPENQPLQGVHVVARPLFSFPGSDFALRGRRTEATGVDGTVVLSLLAPGPYEISVPTRRDVAPVQIGIGEGIEAAAVLSVP